MSIAILTLTIAIAVGRLAYGDVKEYFKQEPVIDWTYYEGR